MAELTSNILEHDHPLHTKIHQEIERLNKTLPNIDKYYLSGNIIPSDRHVPYDSNTNYSIKLDEVHFAILASLAVTCGVIFQPIEKINSRNRGEGMEAKHKLELILHKLTKITDSKHIEYKQINMIPDNIDETAVYVSRELAVLALLVAGFDYRTNAPIHYFKTPQDAAAGKYSLNHEYFVFYAKENLRYTKTQIEKVNSLYRFPLFVNISETEKQRKKRMARSYCTF